MKHLVSAMLIIVGLIHLLPLSGVLGSASLANLYGLQIKDPNLEILMRHRAVLFGLLGAYFVLAAFKPPLQSIAFVIGFASVVSFLALAWSVGDYNAQVGRVFAVDLVALGCLMAGAAAYVGIQLKT